MKQKKKPKVAVILPVYNVMPHLEAMIEHLYESTHFPFKLIIIDSYSNDGTLEYIAELMEEKDNIELHQIPKKGLVNAINYGIKQAGELDIYLTQADVIHFTLYGRDWLLEMYDHAHKKDVGLVIGTGGGGVSGESFVKNMRWAGTWNTYIPRKTIDKVGLYDEDFSGGDDIDYSYRVGLAGLSGIILNFWVQHHQLTERGITHSSDHLAKMGKLFRKKHGIDSSNKSA